MRTVTIFRINNRTLKCTAWDKKNDVAIDITNATIHFNVKKRDTDEEYLFTKSTAEITEIEITDAPAGKFNIYIVPTDTEDLEPGQYYFDVTLVTTGTKRYTLIKGYLQLEEPIKTD